MIKCVFCDFDGTLLNDVKKISKENLECIKDLKKKDIRFVICSGRSFNELKTYFDELEINENDYIIMSNGAYIADRNKRVLYSSPISKNNLLTINEYILRNKISKCALTSMSLYINDEERKPLPDFLDKEAYILCDQRKIKDLIENDIIYKVNITCADKDTYQRIVEEINVLTNNDLTVTHSDVTFLELINKEVSKGAAIDKLCCLYGISKDDCLFIGDSQNDLEGIEFVGYSGCPENSEDSIKNSAQYTSPLNNNQNAVKDIIEHFLNI